MLNETVQVGHRAYFAVFLTALRRSGLGGKAAFDGDMIGLGTMEAIG
jgi:hypothetical protein